MHSSRYQQVFQICALEYSPNGIYLATASDDYTVAIWDVATGKRESRVLKGHQRYVRGVGWSPDSKRIVTWAEDNAIRIFDVETGSIILKHQMDQASDVFRLDFSPSSLHHDIEVASSKHVRLT
jgi:WD40 repeat protein